MKGFRAYFQLTNGAEVRAFSLDFGDGEATGIISLSKESGSEGVANGWYSLDGRKLQGQPSAKGVYIVNGKKVIK